MAKLISNRDGQRLGPALDAIEAMTQPKNRASRRRVRSVSSGGSVRKWVVITSVINPNEYMGELYDYPDGELEEPSIKILVYGAESNEFESGYAAFADKAEDSNGDEVYYIDGFLLG
jgi:hypothetical protein